MNSYEAAVAAEREVRDYAFLDLPLEICGVDVLPMTLRQLVTRLAMDCPFVGGASKEYILRLPDPAGTIASFIWHLSAARRRTRYDVVGEFNARRALARSLVTIPTEEVLDAIANFLEDTFIDEPSNDGDGGGECYTSGAATFVDLFAAEYHWTDARVLDTPLVKLYQLLRARRLRYNPKAILFNKRSTKARRLAILAGEDIFGQRKKPSAAAADTEAGAS